MKRVGSLKRGTIFTYAKKQFVGLEILDDGVFCLLSKSCISVPFHNLYDAPLNNYAKSSLRNTIEGPWLEELLANGGSRDDMVPFDVDLRTTDQSDGYGTLKNVPAAPLTLWQYGKYKDIIPFNEDDWWWLVTPWAIPFIGSQYGSSAIYAWSVHNNGNYGSSHCSKSRGVMPALKLNSDLLVSVAGDDKGEQVDGECDNYTVNLSRVDTASLLKEIKRRIIPTTCGDQKGDCEARDE